ncbi:MAG TPA: O-acetyl-ADP-ribose deacetylase [Longimicrobium sp.]|jgi:O-acetyl-ADP-ribose deacetylase (regulator of RNase III)|uniref:O-acetyl-ADP-ribose deacetylase n=1 Tax=Longimicrobium sp. TaxID=2029185 RepID=UPI002EDAA2DF
MTQSLAGRIEVVQGDITKLDVDAIVNAANTSLLGGGGVDGAIHRAAGPELVQECRMLGGCKVGQAKVTGGYGLPARWVIHTVGPVWQGGGEGEDDLLASCYRESLKIARDKQLHTVAIPAVSTGVYRFPVHRAARIAARETAAFLAANPLPERVMLVCFGADSYTEYLTAVQESV